jgi:hypothetical protein
VLRCASAVDARLDAALLTKNRFDFVFLFKVSFRSGCCGDRCKARSQQAISSIEIIWHQVKADADAIERSKARPDRVVYLTSRERGRRRIKKYSHINDDTNLRSGRA